MWLVPQQNLAKYVLRYINVLLVNITYLYTHVSGKSNTLECSKYIRRSRSKVPLLMHTYICGVYLQYIHNGEYLWVTCTCTIPISVGMYTFHMHTYVYVHLQYVCTVVCV